MNDTKTKTETAGCIHHLSTLKWRKPILARVEDSTPRSSELIAIGPSLV